MALVIVLVSVLVWVVVVVIINYPLPALQLEELVILEMAEKMGDPAKDEGEWIAKIDLVEDGKKLKLVEHEELGKCREECKTVQRAAQEVLSDHDTDIAEKLWQVGTCSFHSLVKSTDG